MLDKISNFIAEHPRLRNTAGITLLLGTITGMRSLDVDGRIHEACTETRSAIAQTACTGIDGHSYFYGVGAMNPDNTFVSGKTYSQK